MAGGHQEISGGVEKRSLFHSPRGERVREFPNVFRVAVRNLCLTWVVFRWEAKRANAGTSRAEHGFRRPLDMSRLEPYDRSDQIHVVSMRDRVVEAGVLPFNGS